MATESLNGDFYRERARFCHKLAEAAAAAKPLFARLFFLAREYEQRAETADLAAGQSINRSSRPTTLPHQLAITADRPRFGDHRVQNATYE
jgi:hypothetical protein